MSSFLCCLIGRPPWQRVSRGRRNELVVETNFAMKKLAVGALRLSSVNGLYDLGTGVLIHNSLVLTSHLNIPNKQSAKNQEFVLTDGNSEPSSSSTPTSRERLSRVLIQKLLPGRCFLTNPSLGVTIVGCEPVSFEVPLDIGAARVSREILRVGRSIYVLGHIEHDDKRKGLVIFGKGKISSEGDQVIEFYSLDGKVWAPGSAGFDEQGDFAFVVGDSKSPSEAKWGLPLLRRFGVEEEASPKQPGILVHFVRDWIRTVWDWGFAELIKANPRFVSTALPSSATKELGTNPIPPVCSVSSIFQDLESVAKGANGVDLREDFQDLESVAKGANGVDLREDFPTRNFCAPIYSSLTSLGSPLQGSALSETSPYVDFNRFSSKLGGIPDLAAKELEGFVELNHGLKEELATAKAGSTHNNFMTGVVKVRYFNKNMFWPDHMPLADNPKQDPNEGSWFDWGKKAPKSRSSSPRSKVACEDPLELRLERLDDSQTIIPESESSGPIKNRVTSQEASLEPTTFSFSPKETAEAAHGDPLDVRLVLTNKDQRTSPEWKPPDPRRDRETAKDSGLQPLRPHFFTDIPQTDSSPWTVLRVDVRSSAAPSEPHPGLGPLSSPNVPSPVSRSIRLLNRSLDQVDSPPREFAFGLIHRSTTSPRSPSRAKAVPWKPPGSTGSGDPGSPLQTLKSVSEDWKVPAAGFPAQGAPRLFGGMTKRFHELTKSAEARVVRKSRDRGQPEKPRWNAPSRVHKKDDSKKLAALPPRIVKPGQFPAELFSSNLSGPAELSRCIGAGSPKSNKEEITKYLKVCGDTTTPNILNLVAQQKCLNIPDMQNCLASPKSRRGRKETGMKTAGSSRMPTIRLSCKDKEKEKGPPKLRIKRLRNSSTSRASTFPAGRDKKWEGQSSRKHERKAQEPLAVGSKLRPNNKANDQHMSCCTFPPQGIVASSRPHSPKAIASVSNEKVTTPTKKCQLFRTDTEILKEIEKLTAVLRSPRCTSVSHEGQGRSSRPEQTFGDASKEELCNMGCGGVDKITNQNREKEIGLGCSQYWKSFITERRDAAVEFMKAVLWPQLKAANARAKKSILQIHGLLAARSGQHRLKSQPYPAAVGEKTQKLQPNGTTADIEQRASTVDANAPPRAQCTPRVFCSPAQEETDVKYDSRSHFDINCRSPRSFGRQTPLQDNLNKTFIYISPVLSPRQHQEAKAWDGGSISVWLDPLKMHSHEKQSHQTPMVDSQLARQQQSKVVTGEEGGSSSCLHPALFPVSPSNATSPNSRLDRETTFSARKHLSNYAAVPETGRPAMSSGQRRPLSPDTRIDGRPATKTEHRVALRDTKRFIREGSDKTLISSEDVELEALIFDTENEDSVPVSKRSGVPELAAAKQKLQQGLAHSEIPAHYQEMVRQPQLAVANQKLQGCLAHPDKAASYQEKSGGFDLAVAKQKLKKCLAHPDKAACHEERSGLPELAMENHKLQKCLPHLAKSPCYPDKSSSGFGSKTNVPSPAEKRSRPVGTMMNNPGDGKRERLGKPTFKAEIGTQVLYSEDDSSLSEIGPIVRYEGSTQVAPAAQGKGVPQWRH